MEIQNSSSKLKFAIIILTVNNLTANTRLEVGQQFQPGQGEVRAEVVAPFPLLTQFDLKQRFGVQDEMKEEDGRLVRRCNWVRFLNTSLLVTAEVNMVGRNTELGRPVFEVVREVGVECH